MEQDLYDYDRLPTLNDEAQEIPDYTSLLDDCTVLALMADADLVRLYSLAKMTCGADKNLHS